MHERAYTLGLVSRHGDEPDRHEPPKGSGLTSDDLDSARELAEFHRLLAADLPPDSRLRGLVLRCAGHWSRLGAIPRNGLAEVGGENRARGRCGG
jgi:hypothetical protein